MSLEPTQQADLLTTFEPTTPKNFVRPRELLDAELWLAGRLREHGVRAVFAGVTDSSQRRERFRQAILDAGIAQVFAGKEHPAATRGDTYAATFESMYHEPLEPAAKPAKRKSHPAVPSAASQVATASSLEDAGAATAASLDDDDIPF